VIEREGRAAGPWTERQTARQWAETMSRALVQGQGQQQGGRGVFEAEEEEEQDSIRTSPCIWSWKEKEEEAAREERVGWVEELSRWCRNSSGLGGFSDPESVNRQLRAGANQL
jgi:hypothetical protein